MERYIISPAQWRYSGGERGEKESYSGGKPGIESGKFCSTPEEGHVRRTFVMKRILSGSKGYRSGASTATSNRPPS